LRRPSHVRSPGASPVGDVEGVLLVGLVVLREALLEPLDPARIQEEEARIVGFQVRMGGELVEEG